MHNKLVAAAVVASFAAAAHAQSSVTLYGTLDAGITYQSNVPSSSSSTVGRDRWSLGNGANQSRFGLRGSEDLGNGLRAVFTLESGVNLGDGASANDGNLFNRQAFVGLSSPFGSVTLGRQYDATQDYLAPLTATGSWGGTGFAHVFNNDNLATAGGYSLNNTIKYSSANLSGLQFGGTYSFSNDTQFSNNRAYSAGAAYQFEGLKLGAAYAQANHPATTTDGAIGMDRYFTGQGRVRDYGVGAAYAYGPAQVGLVWTQSRVANSAKFGDTLGFNNYEFNFKYNVTPALGLGAAYTYSSAKLGASSSHWNQVGLQADYALSRRTGMYAQVIYQRASGPDAPASVYTEDPNVPLSPKANQTAATVGIRHRF